MACSGSSVGGSLRLIFALALGMTKFTASLTAGASMANTSSAGSSQSLFEMLSVSKRFISSDPSIFFIKDSSSSVTRISVGVKPSIMSSPFSLWNEAIILLSTIKASGTTPPPTPECIGLIGWSTSIIASTSPLKVVVTVGTPIFTLPESAITITSASKASLFCSIKSDIVGEPISSSPSIKILIFTGKSLRSSFTTL